MGDVVRAVVQEAFDLTFATSPRVAGATVTLEALYGLDGTDTGTDEAEAALLFPVTMTEGSPGTYSTDVILHSQGPFWARFSVNGEEAGVTVVRVRERDAPTEDATTDAAYTFASVIPTEPASLEISLADSEGADVGLGPGGAPYSYPQSMTQVPGYPDSWYFTPVEFTEGGRVQVALDPPSGPSYNDVITVRQDPQPGAVAHFNGWEPDEGYDPSSWVSLYYIRKWTGWTTGHIADEDLRELRRTAIETFIEVTNMWVPPWTGTWHGLRAQGSRLYLPVPVLLPSDGGIDPVVEYARPYGDQDLVETLSGDDVEWYVRGRHTKQPYMKLRSNWWDHTLMVRITATWGWVGPDRTIPIKVRQAIVGLIRWHALSLGVDADDARDQSTLNRIKTEASRDLRVDYDPRAIGNGITGDRTVDRALVSMRIEPGPWIKRGGSLPRGGRLP